ncbi:MAG: hypothetical protein ACP5FY_00390 [Kosmotogaceae bacterium]
MIIIADNSEALLSDISNWFRDNVIVVESINVESDKDNISILVEISKNDMIETKQLMVEVIEIKGVRNA